ncbi:MAG: ribonuclease Z [Bacteroidetes bacterium]|nr:ribonuclease Z [Bacteroidota bacterium]HET6244250.1 ribonuclease Z [Bacteroidia bacterium]
MKFELTILGCSSATPTSNRFPTAQVLNILERFFLIDCGEGTQMQLRKYKVKMQRINHVFISHLHGDHYFGLIGLLSTMHLLGRKNSLTIHAHADLENIINLQLKASDTRLNYQINFNYLKFDKSILLVDDPYFTVETIILKHRIPCCGFLFREKPRLKKLKKEKLAAYGLSITDIRNLREGKDFIDPQGKVISNGEFTYDSPPARSYAYCSDTAYNEAIIEQIKNVDLLYHEATFTLDFVQRAKETFHSTAEQAATIAAKANVKKLIIGHYSARYKDVEPLVLEAQKVFKKTLPAIEGESFEIKL